MTPTDPSGTASGERSGNSRSGRQDGRQPDGQADDRAADESRAAHQRELPIAAEAPGGPASRAQSARIEDGGDNPWEFWRSVLITLAIALGIRQYLVEARYIPSGSMLPGLQLQDRLLVEKLSYRNRLPRRGEIVVFHAPHHFDPVLRSQNGEGGPLQCLLVNLPLIGSIPGLQQPACDAFIKRVIALPGERLAVDPRGRVTIDGTPLQEPYVKNFCPVDAQGMGPCRTLNVVVPPDHVVVLGDNRGNSWDGRFWPGGPFLPRQEIIGRAFFRFFPFTSIGSLGSSSAPAR